MTLGGSFVSSVLTFVGTVVITRGLPIAAAGLVLESIGLFIILAALASFGADTGMVRITSKLRALGATTELRSTAIAAFAPSLAAGVILSAIAYVFAPQLVDLFFQGGHQQEAIRLVRLMMLFVPFAAMTRVFTAGTRGLGTMVPYVAVQNVTLPGLRPIFMLAVLAAGAGAMGVALAWSVPVAIGFAMSASAFFLLLARAERRAGLGAQPPRGMAVLASEFWRFSFPRGVANIFQLGVIYMDVLLVGGLRSTREAAIYAAGSRLVAVGTLAMEALGYAIAPQIAGLLTRGDRQAAQRLFQTSTWWLNAMTWPVFMALGVYAPLLLRIFGPAFVEGQSAVVILSLGILFQVGTGNNSLALVMAGRSGWSLAIYIVSFAVNLTLNLVLIPRYGINGAALAWMASWIVTNGAAGVLLATRIGLHPFGTGWLVTAGGAVFLFGLGGLLFRFVLGLTVPSLIVYGVVATTAYVALLWRCRRLLRLHALLAAVRARRVRSEVQGLDAG